MGGGSLDRLGNTSGHGGGLAGYTCGALGSGLGDGPLVYHPR
jgi:hypothetical protein